jgi:hypothetical protein
MPVVIAPDRWAEWLGEQLAPLDALKDLLAMAFWPVDPGTAMSEMPTPICSQPYPWGIGH